MNKFDKATAPQVVRPMRYTGNEREYQRDYYKRVLKKARRTFWCVACQRTIDDALAHTISHQAGCGAMQETEKQ